jgi:potassium-dependent mechanosensitive channel
MVALEGEAREVEAELGKLREVGELGAGAEEVAAALERLEERAATLPARPAPSGDELSTLRTEAAGLRERVTALLEAASGRSRRLEELRRRWQAQRASLLRWRLLLRADPGFAAVEADLVGGISLSDTVIGELTAATPAAIALQQQLQGLAQRSEELDRRSERLERDWRRQLRSRNGPALLSPAYRASWSAPLGEELRRGLGAAVHLDPAFLGEHDGLLLAHLALLLAVALAARRLRRHPGGDEHWRGLLGHPWALGTFASVVALGRLYEPVPPAWRLLLAAALAASVALIAAGTFRRRRKRWPIYLLAILYLVFHAAEAVALPAPLYRPLLLLLTLAPAPWVLYLARREVREEGRESLLAICLRLAAALAAVIALAEIAGYHAFARWLLDAALNTTFVLFAATFLTRLSRKLVRFAVGSRWAARFPYLERIGPELSLRLAGLARLVIALVAALYAADLWGLAASPARAWQWLVALSLGFGTHRFSVGQVLLAAAALYVAVIVSWLVRAFLDQEMVSHPSLERGVGDSVKKLVHYGLVALGFFLGLSLAGVSLQSFAILAGAFGVGIGFGLQNIVNNFVSGIILLFERPVRTGDTVVVGGDWGTVRRIGLRSTVIETFDRAEIIVPNSELISEKVTNWTLSDRVARAVLSVGVAYGSDYRRVLEVLDALAREHPQVSDDPAPYSSLVGFGDSSVNFELRAWIRDVDHRLRTQSDLFARIAERFAEEGIEIPFPQRDLHLRSLDPEAAAQLVGTAPVSPPRQDPEAG